MTFDLGTRSLIKYLWCFVTVIAPVACFAEDNFPVGDIEYGAYLSGECLTCHSLDSDAEGIPSIIGLDPEGFAAIMMSYRDMELPNEVMRIVAGRLDNEQIASLALYFSSLSDEN